MKITATIALLVLTNICYAQITFHQITPPLPASQLVNEFSAAGDDQLTPFDYDNDGDIDLFLTSFSNSNGIAKLYTNDGNGNYFERKDVHFDYVDQASAGVADVDGDNDLDILIIGEDSLFNPSAKLYLNNCGTFQKVLGTPFVGAYLGRVAFADVDMDNDQDVIISGVTGWTMEPVKLYKNDGNGNFTYVPGTPMVPSHWGTVEFADIDGDLDPDLLITGESGSGGIVTKLYKNDGSGNFSLTASPFPGIRNSATEFADVDNDNDLDVVIHGWRMVATTTVYETDLYKNDGTGVFTIASTPFTQHGSGNVAFSDIDDDNDKDLVVSGFNASGALTKYYRNDGTGNFTFTLGESFSWATQAMDLIDIDNDGDDDIVNVGPKIINFIQLNDGTGLFSGTSGSAFYAIGPSASDMADVDGDNDLDIVMSGIKDVGQNLGYYTGYYLNDGSAGYTLAPSSVFLDMGNAAIKFADVDGDLDQDIFMAGESPVGRRTKLFKNDGSGNYTEELATTFTGLGYTDITVGDVDGDLDVDFLISGTTGSVPTTQLYLNDGTGIFALDAINTFPQVWWGSLNLFDMDGDNDLDLLLTGRDVSYVRYTKLFSNDGSGIYTEVVGTPFTNIDISDAEVGDLDGDGDIDILLMGEDGLGKITELFLNNGTGSFSLLASSIVLTSNGDVKFADLDNDSDLDVIISGNTNGGEITDVYFNDGLANFTLNSNNTHLYPSQSGSLSIGDVDGDNLKDVFVTGINDAYKFARLFVQGACEPQYGSYSYSGCGSFVSGSGTTYMSSGTYVEVVQNPGACDSILTYCVSVSPNSSSLITELACGNYTAPSGAIYTSSGIYQDIITNSFGCDSLITIDLTLSFDSGSVMTETACNSFVSPWGTVYNSSGNYVHTVPNAAGCDSVITLDLTVISIDSGISQTGLTLTSNDQNATYQWIDCTTNNPINGEINQSYLVSSNGSYAVELTNSGCSDTSACIYINDVNIDELISDNLINIYPNPSGGNFVLEHDLDQPQMTILNVFGKVVYYRQLSSLKETIELDVAQGVYYVSLVSGDLALMKKILIY